MFSTFLCGLVAQAYALRYPDPWTADPCQHAVQRGVVQANNDNCNCEIRISTQKCGKLQELANAGFPVAVEEHRMSSTIPIALS